MTKQIITSEVVVEKDTDPGYRNFIKRMASEASHVDIGIHPVSGEEIVMIAGVHEFGTDRAGKNHNIIIPERSFIRSTVDEKREQYGELGKKLWNKILEGKMSIFQGLSLMGQQVENDIRVKIVTLKEPINADATIARKKSDNPLIDTGAMVNSIRYAVKDKNNQPVGEMSDEGTYNPSEE